MKPRRDQKPYLTRALSAAQSRQLRHWLLVEEITYAAARQRLKDRFGISASNHQLYNFFQSATAPAPGPSKALQSVTLDLRITRVAKGWHFLLVNRAPGIRVTVNRHKLRPGIFHHSSP